MISTLIGYFPKHTSKGSDSIRLPGVEQVCSVSSCVSRSPGDWISNWRHNALWVYDTEELALSIVAPEERSEFELYAYFMFPVRFVDGRLEPFDLPALRVQPLRTSFSRLGYDAVSRTQDNEFECSPLSCNGMAQHIAVNRYCLVDTEPQAFEIARDFSIGKAEPGPYYVVEVWREVLVRANSGSAGRLVE